MPGVDEAPACPQLVLLEGAMVARARASASRRTARSPTWFARIKINAESKIGMLPAQLEESEADVPSVGLELMPKLGRSAWLAAIAATVLALAQAGNAEAFAGQLSRLTFFA